MAAAAVTSKTRFPPSVDKAFGTPSMIGRALPTAYDPNVSSGRRGGAPRQTEGLRGGSSPRRRRAPQPSRACRVARRRPSNERRHGESTPAADGRGTLQRSAHERGHRLRGDGTPSRRVRNASAPDSRNSLAVSSRSSRGPSASSSASASSGCGPPESSVCSRRLSPSVAARPVRHRSEW